MKEKFKLTALERSWILYDIGNSAFTLLVSTLLPIYFNSLATAAGLSESDYLAYWGYAASIVTVIVAILGPICGTMADQGGLKKALFLGAMFIGALGCAALGVAWSWLSFLVIFVIAKVGYSSANVFYDSMLPEITTPEKIDRVSTLGYALGYIGSVIPFAICLVLVLMHDSFGMTQVTALIISFVLTAIWWVVCSLPLAKRYKQTAFHAGGGQPIVRSCFLPNEEDDIQDTFRAKRAAALYSEDERQQLRQSHKNTQVQKLYDEFLGKPNSHKAHELLHTHYQARVGFK
mgnify:CR=1 FL=1